MKQFGGFRFTGNIPAGLATDQVGGFFGHQPQRGGFAPDDRHQAG